MNVFLETIKKEGVDYEKILLKVNINDESGWNGLVVLKSPENFDFETRVTELFLHEDILSKVRVDVRPEIKLAHGFAVSAVEFEEKQIAISSEVFDLLDWNSIYFEILQYKISQGYTNLGVRPDVLRDIATSNAYALFAPAEPLTLTRWEDLDRIRRVVLSVLKGYITKFYNAGMKRAESSELRLEPLTPKHENFLQGYVLQIPESETALIAKIRHLLEQSDKIYRADTADIPTIHFDKHPYAPLVVFGKDRELIRSVPTKVNEGETDFVVKLRYYTRAHKDQFRNVELFLLRNLAKRGVRFFQTSGFYPDFIMWIRESGKQHLVFIDPKGILHNNNSNDEKIRLFESIKEIEQKLGNPNVAHHSFILSVSRYSTARKNFEGGRTNKGDFEDHHVLFLEDFDIIPKLLKGILGLEVPSGPDEGSIVSPGWP